MKLTKKNATSIIRSIIPAVRVDRDPDYPSIDAYIAQTPALTVTCRYDHIMPWSHIRVSIDADAARSITLLYDPDTLQRDRAAEDAEK